jgi:UDP-N-acetylmuramoylalanine--D-glutamate ligase
VAFCSSRGADPDCEVSLEGGVILRGGEPLVEAARLRLLGEHNVANGMAAAAAALAMGMRPDAVREGLVSFAGIPHRLERVREVRGVTFVNDSKATNVAAAAAALHSFEGRVHAILGGSLKGESFEGLVAPASKRCVACYLIGEAAERLATELEPAREAGVELRRCGGMEHAVRAAAKVAAPGQVVLLAPACASFDAYRDFEARGEHFRQIVESLR